MVRPIRILALTLALLLCLSAAALAEVSAPMSLNADEHYAMSLFLSNFTEVGADRICPNDYDDMQLVDFAHDHLWFNGGKFEYGEWFNDNNCRISDSKIQSIVGKYFYDARRVDLSATRYDYNKGYYYHQETGGFCNYGFANVISAVRINPNEKKYFVSFCIYGGGDEWSTDDIRLSSAKLADKFGDACGFGSALIYATDLSDRNTYKLISFSRN